MPIWRKALLALAPAGAMAKTVFTNATDGKKSVGRTLQTLFTSVLMTGFTLGISMFTARTLGAEGRGVFVALLLFPQLLAGFAGIGLPNSFIYHARKYPDHIPVMLGWTFLFVLLSTTILTLVGSLLVGYAAKGTDWVFLGNMVANLPADLRGFVVNFLWIAIPIAALAQFTATLAQGLSNFNVFNGARLLLPAAHLILMLLVWTVTRFDARTAALCYVGAAGIAVVWTLWRFAQYHRPRLSERPAFLRSYLQYGFGTYGIEILGVFSSQVDKIFILAVLNLRDLGIYSVAFGLSRVLGLLQNSVASVIFPATANQPISRVVTSVARAARISLALSLMAGLPLILFGSPLLKLVFGHEFAEGALVLQVLVVEVIVSGTAWILAQAFNSAGRPGLVVARQAIGLMVGVILLAVLAPRYGAEGVAFALLAGGAVRLLITILCFPWALGCAVPQLVPTISDLKFAYRQLTEHRGT
ncbi:MAG: oligosaccharide flippase family protein [Pseudomonadota bacterium]